MTAGAVALITCSMAKDLDLFAILARSVDECVDEDIVHHVIVPGREIGAFRGFGSARRRIIAQEDVLPLKVLALPRFLKALAPVAPVFRRPLYLDRRLRLVRGWIIQQLIKIETSRAAPQKAVVHVDSDVFFVRRLSAGDILDGDRVRFFRAGGAGEIPVHREWSEAAARAVGAGAPPSGAHYIENCVIWSPGVVRDLVARIEAVHGRPWHEALRDAGSFSEYFVYGVYADLVRGGAGLSASDASLCHSYWDAAPIGPGDMARHLGLMRAHHRAVAVQSTHAFTAQARRALYDACRERAA